MIPNGPLPSYIQTDIQPGLSQEIPLIQNNNLIMARPHCKKWKGTGFRKKNGKPWKKWMKRLNPQLY